MYTPPTTEAIMEDLRASVQAEVTGTDPWVWPNNLVPMLKAFAQIMRAGYLRLGYIHEQSFVTTAREEYLDWHGIQAGGLSRSPATYAQGAVVATTVAGTVIPEGTELTRFDNVKFVTISTTTAVTTSTTFQVKSEIVGELPNTDPGATLTVSLPITGLGTCIVGSGGIIGGRPSESDESFRQRILFHKQNPPHGGSPAEYVEWAQTKAGVTRVFVKRATPQAGSVTIYFMQDSIGDGLPNAADVDSMQAILDSLAPSDADVIVAAPTPSSINVTISGLIPDTPSMRDSVMAELKAMFMRRAEPASITEPTVFARAWLDEAISMAPGWSRHLITVPPGDVTVSTPGAIPMLGTVTFMA